MHSFEISTTLSVPADVVWQHATDMAGVNAELQPLLRMTVPAGTHQVAVRLKDDAGKEAFGYEREKTVTLAPAQILVIDFDPQQGGITLR